MNEGDVVDIDGVRHVVAHAEAIHAVVETSFVCAPNFFWKGQPPTREAPSCLFCVTRRRLR